MSLWIKVALNKNENSALPGPETIDDLLAQCGDIGIYSAAGYGSVPVLAVSPGWGAAAGRSPAPQRVGATG